LTKPILKSIVRFIMIELEPSGESDKYLSGSREDRVFYGVGSLAISAGLSEVWFGSRLDAMPVSIQLLMVAQGVILATFGAVTVSHPHDSKINENP
jgi:hypothetical protein